jgi:hypothetical protein
MDMKWISFFILLFSSLSGFSQDKKAIIESWELPNDELVIIQAVSTTKKNFVVRRGFDEGVSVGQESLFSTASFSVLCRAVEVTRHHSLWVPLDKRAKVPFERKDYVTFSNNVEKVSIKIADIVEQKKESAKWKRKEYWITRFSISAAMWESVSETNAEREANRGGFQFEIYGSRRIFEDIELALGVRFDQETAIIDESNLEIPTTRYMLMGEFVYNFAPVEGSKDHFYAALGGGVGLSSTTVNEQTNGGVAYLGPLVRLGYKKSLSPKYSFLLEGVGEAISMEEKLENDDTQTTNIVNLKFSMGLKF